MQLIIIISMCVCACVCTVMLEPLLMSTHYVLAFVKLPTFSITVYIKCVLRLFSALSHRVGTLQISIIIMI